ncbi:MULTISPECIES: hypothetical protein [Methylobacterium]|jgi:hypothetical protein|uniref:hypothetical protein n=1 Tax=Methylobacterium TaxID=407 RepID=UPI0008E66E8C|nr:MULTISPECIES: hypothetical protein [Methylobacterium]MBZ6416510.1 hypothetical protein [Methylobacterium sp.]MBK3395720.1 hypothetical protein [Methylobacterium ajmalii]MBK3407500.1 hypothetical protein [Methylobacterium ajmalii]MBK3424277.1 hypothetical protein [Methylobacterium ajmalii]SFF70473.1 hypothetical protein SAMN04487844_14017 [Methylobacterium sp. yr596]
MLAVLASLCVAACNTVAPNRLSLADTASLRFAAIDVRSTGAAIDWTSAEDEYLRGRNLSLTDPALVRTPEAQGFIRDLAARRLKAALERALAARPEGARPVRLVVTLVRVDIPSAARRILVGGAPTIRANIEIVDARTGAVLTTYSGDQGIQPAGQGVLGVVVDGALTAGGMDDLYDRAANDFARRFRNWLTAGA